MRIIKNFLFLGLLLITACMQNLPDEAETVENTLYQDSLSHKMITARLFIHPENVTDFIEAAKSMIDSSNAEPGCISYMLYQNPYDHTQLIFVEEWKDQAAIDTHFAMPYFRAFGPKTSDWRSQPTEVKIFDVKVVE